MHERGADGAGIHRETQPLHQPGRVHVAVAYADIALRHLLDYSLRPKTTALYRIDRATKTVVHVMDLPGAGDNAFPTVVRPGAHSWLLANYTSPLDVPDITWFRGQESPRGTLIYLLDLNVAPM